tara:strand:+ start:355 stop:570 length:216 start_codon:yes stop_codon:yes gene_type:complete
MNAILERLDKIEDTLSNQIQDKWLNIKEASQYASLSITRIRKAVILGELKVSKNGGRLLFKSDWIDKWLND